VNLSPRKPCWALGFVLVLQAVLGAVPAAAEGSFGASISIRSFTAVPDHLEILQKQAPANASLRLVLMNAGTEAGTVNVIVAEKGKVLFSADLTVNGSSDLELAINWSVKDQGDHKATAVLAGEAAAVPSSAEAPFRLVFDDFLSALDNPSPPYTIPCAFAFLLLPVLALWLFMRRLRGDGDDGKDGENEKRGNR